MDIKSAHNELTALKAKLASIVADVQTSGRNLTDSEVDVLEKGTSRVVELKGFLDSSSAANSSRPDGDSWENFPKGLGGPSSTEVTERKGFLTPASVKRTAAAAAQNVKALVSGGSTVTPVALDTDPIRLGQSGLGLLSLIPVTVRTTPKYSYIAQTVRENNAAVVAPGAEKPVSPFSVKSVDNELAVYAHLSEPIGKYVLQDSPSLATFLDMELQNGILRKITADAVAAFSTANGIQTVAFNGSAADSVYTGLSRVTSLGHSIGLIVMNTDDYDAVRLSKNDEGSYYGGSVFDGSARAGLWGVNTVVTPDIPKGKALVLGAEAVGLSTDAAGIVTEWDPFSRFSTNEAVARTETRAAFDVFRPEAIALVSLTA